jgi:hypothetical protein
MFCSKKLNDFWSSCVPAQFIHDIKRLDIVLDAMFARQQWIINYNKRVSDAEKIDERAFIVLDDVSIL